MIFPDKALATKLEKSLAQDMLSYVHAFNKLFPDIGATFVEAGGGIAIYTGDKFINTAIGMGLETPVSIAEFEELEDFFRSHQVSSHIEICPFTDVTLLHHLNRRNYHLMGFTTAYIHPLDKSLQEPPKLNRNIVVEPIDDSDKDVWVDTVMDVESGDKAIDVRLAQAVTYRQNTICFLARLDGKPVGASALSIRDGIGTFYFTATRGAYRNFGVQTAMIQARLAYAQEAGCEMAFATTNPGNQSMRNVMRAGFQVAYVRCMYGKRRIID